MPKKKTISKREAERRMMQSAYSPRKISEAEANRWLKSAKIERAIDQEIAKETAELAEWQENREPGVILRIVAFSLLCWVILLLGAWLWSAARG